MPTVAETRLVAHEPVPTTRRERSERTAALVDELRACTDDEEAAALRERIVLLNRGVAEAVANRYRRRGVPEDDLVQVAYLGLVRAVERFDPDRGHDLLTFAVPTIRGELARYFRDHGWMVRPPRRIAELQIEAARTAEDLAHQLGREPTEDELAAELDVTVADLRDALAAYGAFAPDSLDRPVRDDAGTTRGDQLAAGGDPASDGALHARIELAPVVRALSDRDRDIIRMRFYEDRSQKEIGASLGVSQAQVSRILTRILGDLRSELG